MKGRLVLGLFLVLLVLALSGSSLAEFKIDFPTGIAWKPDGTYALIVGYGGTVRKYDGNSLIQLNTEINEGLDGAAFSPDGTFALIVGGNWPSYNEGVVLKFNGEEFEKIPLVGRENEKEKYWDAAFGANGEAIIVGENPPCVYKFKEGKCFRLNLPQSSDVTYVSWWENEFYITGDLGAVWKLNGDNFQHFDNAPAVALRNFAWDPIEKKWAIVPACDGSIWIYNEYGQFQKIREAMGNEFLFKIAFSSKGDYAIIIGYEVIIKVIPKRGENSLNFDFKYLDAPKACWRDIAFHLKENYALIVGNTIDEGMVLKFDGENEKFNLLK